MAKETVERVVKPAVAWAHRNLKKRQTAFDKHKSLQNKTPDKPLKKKDFQGEYSLLDSNLKKTEIVADEDGVLRPQNIHEEQYIIQQVQRNQSTAGFNKIERVGHVDKETGNPINFRVKDGGTRGGGYNFKKTDKLKGQAVTRNKAIEAGQITEENSLDTFKQLMGIKGRDLDEIESMALVDYVQQTARNNKEYKASVKKNKNINLGPDQPNPYGFGNYMTDGHVFPPKDPRHLDVAEQRHLEPAMDYVDELGRTMKGNYRSGDSVGFSDEDLVMFGIPRNRYEHMENFFYPNRKGVRSFLQDVDTAMIQRKSGVGWETIFAEQGIEGSPRSYM